MEHIDRTSISSPSSTTSGCVSSVDMDNFPTKLADEEIQLALNKDATDAELQNAILRCKDLVLESDNCSSERKWLVRHLIELRLRLQECKDAKNDPQHPRNKSSGVSTRTIRGHHLNLQPFFKYKDSWYCDHCTGRIWHVIQAWYKCEDCGYSCHHKCLTSIVRECAHITATERGTYELEICPLDGLSAQKYKCAECKTTLPISTSLTETEEYRLCDYSGLYYCLACHWGSRAVIPARVIHNWDFEPRPVSQAAMQQLRLTAPRPLLNLTRLNPTLFTHVQELSLVRRLRNELHAMWRYLLVCRRAQAEHLLWRLLLDRGAVKPKPHAATLEGQEVVGIEDGEALPPLPPHLVETPELYSLEDLVETQSGELCGQLAGLQCTFLVHIKETCDVCRGRGHICEICSNAEVLFPFDSIAVICKDCNAVFHKKCYRRKEECPKCLRIKKRSEKESITTDYADFD